MIHKQTEILIKDNSGFSKARVINIPSQKSKGCGVARAVNTVIVNKANQGIKKKITLNKRSILQDLLIIQTKKPIMRYDGSSVAFSSNCGVAITKSKDSKLQLDFKRINTAVSLEVKKINSEQFFRGSYNIIKLAKSLI